MRGVGSPRRGARAAGGLAAACLALAAAAPGAASGRRGAPAPDAAAAAADAASDPGSPARSLTPEPPADPDAPTVTARIEPATGEVGDPLILTVTSIAPARVAVNLPAQLDLGPVTLLERTQQETDLGDGRMRRDFILTVTAFEPGEWTVPSIALTYLGAGGAIRSARTPEVALRIRSVIANEPEPALRPDSGPVEVQRERRWPLYLAGGLLVLALGLVLGRWAAGRLRARRRAPPPPPPRPPHEVALEKLRRLDAALDTREDLRPAYFELSEILREYLGGRFGFDALERTTGEVMAALRERPLAGSLLSLGELEGWLSGCDLVKFARTTPGLDQTREALAAARGFVTRSQPAPEPAPAAPPAASREEVSHG